MMIFFKKKPRKEALELQLTAMIDILTITVIFLIKATVFATSDMNLQPGMKLPDSISKETSESAPQIAITATDVVLGQINKDIPTQKIPLADFKLPPGSETPQSIAQLRVALKSYLDTLPPETKNTGAMLNILADRESPYEDVFDVAKTLRQSGFETLLFVATGDKAGNGSGEIPVGIPGQQGVPGQNGAQSTTPQAQPPSPAPTPSAPVKAGGR